MTTADRHVDPLLRRGITIRFLQILATEVVIAVVLFACAGRWQWTRAWIFLGLSMAVVALNAAYVLPRNPEVIVERGRRHRGTQRFDRAIIPLYSLATIALYAVAGLDAGRFAWAPLAPEWAWLGGALLVLGTIPIASAMAANRNLETTVRIQSERGHEVATTGAYRYVRHPMYVGSIVQLAATPLALGSAWAFVPAAIGVVLVVVRTALEDRTLRAQLPGYDEYARRTRYRLVPGVW